MTRMRQAAFVVLSVVTVMSPPPVCSRESREQDRIVAADEIPPDVSFKGEEGATAEKVVRNEKSRPPSSLWKKTGGWGAAGAVFGTIAPGIGNLVGFFCGITVGVVHHLLSD